MVGPINGHIIRARFVATGVTLGRAWASLIRRTARRCSAVATPFSTCMYIVRRVQVLLVSSSLLRIREYAVDSKRLEVWTPCESPTRAHLSFQSTLPAWGATARGGDAGDCETSFNPRSPRGDTHRTSDDTPNCGIWSCNLRKNNDIPESFQHFMGIGDHSETGSRHEKWKRKIQLCPDIGDIFPMAVTANVSGEFLWPDSTHASERSAFRQQNCAQRCETKRCKHVNCDRPP